MEKEGEPQPEFEQAKPGQQSGEGDATGELDAESRKRLTRLAQQHYDNSMLPFYAEIRFQQAGLTEVLEGSGILPSEENPNPYDIRTNPSEHEQWWSELPEAGDAFDESIRIREERLRLLYIGALLGPYLRRFTREVG